MIRVGHSQETIDNVRNLYLETRNSEEVSRRTGISQTNVRRWCKDLVDAQSAARAGKMLDKARHVEEMRRECHATGKVDIAKYMAKYNQTETWIRRAISGLSHQSLNTIVPPFKIDVKKSAEEQKAKALYAQGKSYKAIEKELGVARSSLSRWLKDMPNKPVPAETKKNDSELREKVRALYATGLTTTEVSEQTQIGRNIVLHFCKDLVAERRASTGLQTKPRVHKIRERNGCQVLNKEDVIFIRETVRQTGQKNWKRFADQYKTTMSVISGAARGLTFKSLDAVCPPVTDADIKACPKAARKTELAVSEAQLEEMYRLRRSAPLEWTYGKLATWLRTETGRLYRASHVATMLVSRYPDVKALEAIKPSRLVKPRVPVERRKKTPEEIRAHAQRMKQQRDELRRMIALENAFERATQKRAA